MSTDDPGSDQARDVKQVIVIRRDLHMRRGKEIAQGAHASSAWLIDLAVDLLDPDGRGTPDLDGAALQWMTRSSKKVAVQVRTEDELVALHTEALGRGLRSHLIRDAGTTEFGGVPTLTALAIGPNWSTEIDEVTGSLSLY